MESLLTSPTLIDLILIFTTIEAVVLILWRRRRVPRFCGASDWHQVEERRPAVGLMLLPGVCLLLAVRAALAGAAMALGARGADRGADCPPAGSSSALGAEA